MEISWISLCDVSGLFKAMPNLMFWQSKGCNELSIQPFTHHQLTCITLIVGANEMNPCYSHILSNSVGWWYACLCYLQPVGINSSQFVC